MNFFEFFWQILGPRLLFISRDIKTSVSKSFAIDIFFNLCAFVFVWFDVYVLPVCVTNDWLIMASLVPTPGRPSVDIIDRQQWLTSCYDDTVVDDTRMNICVQTESEVQTLTKRVRQLEEDFEQTETRLHAANEKFSEASKAADESERWFTGDTLSHWLLFTFCNSWNLITHFKLTQILFLLYEMQLHRFLSVSSLPKIK